MRLIVRKYLILPFSPVAGRIKLYFNQKLAGPLVGFLKQGVTPRKLALTVALGFVIGLFPSLGITSILCILLALILRLNLPAILLINFFAYPLQLIFFIPFIKIGEFIFGATPLPLSFSQIISLVETDLSKTLNLLWMANLMGMFAWLVIAIPLALILYFVSYFIFEKVTPRQ